MQYSDGIDMENEKGIELCVSAQTLILYNTDPAFSHFSFFSHIT
jgi:hypothetical protein